MLGRECGQIDTNVCLLHCNYYTAILCCNEARGRGLGGRKNSKHSSPQVSAQKTGANLGHLAVPLGSGMGGFASS